MNCESFPGFPDREFIVKANKTGAREADKRNAYDSSSTPKADRKLHVANELLEDLSRFDFEGSDVEIKTLFDKMKDALVPVGTVIAYAGDRFPPADYNGNLFEGTHTPTTPMLKTGGKPQPIEMLDGWLLCDGQDIPEGDKYNALRSMFSDGKTPNLACRTIISTGDPRDRNGKIVEGFGEFAPEILNSLKTEAVGAITSE